MNDYHISVLLQEVIQGLHIQSGKIYLDGTLGGGGHALAILKKGGRVLGIDHDQDALDAVKDKFRIQNLEFKINKEIFLVKGNFRDIDTIAKNQGFEQVAGILLDLGVSSHHFDTGDRGFSVLYDAPLDMRMDQSLAVTAKDLINGLTRSELTELFTNLGEERFAKRIAERITYEREKKAIETTKELADIVSKAVPKGAERIHPATRVFQALRIAVNDELHSLQEVLPKAVKLLEPGGRLVVISFHSLEDRIVKNSFQEFAAQKRGVIVTPKPIIPSEEEQLANKRSRSAKLRIFEKNYEKFVDSS